MLFQRTKELYTWRLEQGQEISALRKRLDKDNDIIVDNRQSIAQTSQDLRTLSGTVRIVAHQQEYLQALGARGQLPSGYMVSSL